jgi:hypothetical protein
MTIIHITIFISILHHMRTLPSAILVDNLCVDRIYRTSNVLNGNEIIHNLGARTRDRYSESLMYKHQITECKTELYKIEMHFSARAQAECVPLLFSSMCNVNRV